MAFALALAVLSAACGGGGGGSPPPPPPPPPVTVTVAPTTQNVLLGATQTFTATVTNAASTSVTWSVNGVTGGNSTVGTIDANGLYRGPAILPSPAAVTIRAISVSSPTSSGTATVTVTSDVIVSIIAPAQNFNVEVGAQKQATAAIASTGNGADQNVTWIVSGNGCAGAACGTINSVSGLFTAPGILPATACSLPATGVNCVTVTATSVADSTKSATLTLHIVANFTFTVTGPASGSIDNATQFQFVPTFTPVLGSNPSRSINWSVSGSGCAGTACGTIDQAGLYTAPNSAPSPPQVTISATPLADPSKAQSVTVTINSIVLVAITPATLDIEIEGQQNFTANVGGTQNQNVTWNITGPGCTNPGTPCGQLSVGPGQVVVGSVPVIYTAPITIPSGGIGPVTITATSQAPPNTSASTMLTFFSTISASLQPSGSTRAVNHRVTLFGGLLRTSTGTVPVANAVDWTVIDSQGNRFPGGNSTVGLICTVALIGCTPPGSTAAGNPQGDVDYVAPASVPQGQTVLTVSIEMRSQADPSKSAAAQVSVILSVQISVLPTTTTLPPGQSQPFTANVVGAANQSVTWDVNGVVSGNASLGQICVAGSNPCLTPSVPTPPNQSVEYRAPSSVPTPNPVTVTATSADDLAKSASGTVTISTGPFISKILPASITALDAQTSTSFALKVQGINFTPSSPGPGSVIIFSGTRFDGQSGRPSTNCSSTSECTAQVRVSDVSIPSIGLVVQIENPGNPPTSSNSPFLVVLDAATQQKDFAAAANAATGSAITLSAGSPNATNVNITVVEPTTMGGQLGAAGQVNISFVCDITGGSCVASGTLVPIKRPASGSVPAQFNIFLTGSNGLLTTYKYSISGPSPPDLTFGLPQASGSGVILTLTVPSTSKLGTRTIFVETLNREKSALVDAIEVK